MGDSLFGLLVGGTPIARIDCQQSPEFQQKIRRAYHSLYLYVSISPLPPWFGYIFIIWSPFHLYLKRHTVLLRGLISESPIVPCLVMRLPTTGKMFYL